MWVRRPGPYPSRPNAGWGRWNREWWAEFTIPKPMSVKLRRAVRLPEAVLQRKEAGSSSICEGSDSDTRGRRYKTSPQQQQRSCLRRCSKQRILGQESDVYFTQTITNASNWVIRVHQEQKEIMPSSRSVWLVINPRRQTTHFADGFTT